MKVRVIQTIHTEAGDFYIEEGYENWEASYRLRFEERITEWGGYNDALMIGDHIAVSPYYTTKDEKLLYGQAFDTDEVYLNIRWPVAGAEDDHDEGWIHCIYGNSPEELISNHTVNLTKYTIPTQEYIKAFYDPSYIIDKGE